MSLLSSTHVCRPIALGINEMNHFESINAKLSETEIISKKNFS